MASEKKTPAEKMVARVRDYHQVFGSQAGKRILYDMMREHKMLSTSFSPGDPQVTAFNEGGRNVIVRLLGILKTSPEQLRQHIEESENG